jgi:hypothetical protein
MMPRQLAGLGAGPKDALKPEELPSGILFIYPRYVLKVLGDLLDAPESLAQIQAWSYDPPEWVKKKNKLGQDSYRLAAFLRTRLNFRIPKNWFDSQIDSDASLVIEGKRKYSDVSTETLAEWATNPPPWRPWNRDRDITAVVMPAILWAQRIVSARAGFDIPFFVDSSIEEISDDLVRANDKDLLDWVEALCNMLTSWGISSANAAGKEVTKQVVEKTATQTAKDAAPGLWEQAKKKALEEGTKEAKRAGTALIRKGISETGDLLTPDGASTFAKEGIQSAEAGVTSAALAFAFASTPIGWVSLAAIAAAPVLCWGAKSYALKLIKDNLRDWHPDFVPTFIGSVYQKRFGIVPGADVISNLDQRYSALISANSIAKAVASPENDPAVLAAVTKRQNEIQATITKSLDYFGCKTPNPDRVAAFADRAFNNFWSPEEINRRVYNEKAWLCSASSIKELRTIVMRPAISSAAARITKAVAAMRNSIKPPIAPVTPSGKPPVGPVPPAGPAKGGIGPALALATGGFFVGGPPGAGIGFVLGLMAGKKK